MKRTNIVLTGDVDSGKSTLIGRLLYDTNSISSRAKEGLKDYFFGLNKEIEFAHLLDSFQEEREEEFTLDTTQVLLKHKNRQYLLIDVPGHRQLLKNMLTGASFADASVLIIDIKSGVEDQTRRHSYILKFLGIDKIIIAISKMDLICYNEESFTKIKDKINILLKETGLNAIYIIPVCAKEGENIIEKSSKMSWYRGPSLIDSLSFLGRKEQVFRFRFPIQDIYERSQEKIAVGTVASGRIKRNDYISVPFLKNRLKVKEIKMFNKFKRKANLKESIGLVFEAFADELKRGVVLYEGDPPNVINRIKAKIFCLCSLHIQENLSIGCATQKTSARIEEIIKVVDTATLKVSKNDFDLQEFDAAEVTIVTEEPLVFERFCDVCSLGRFVLEKDNVVCAIGIII